MDRSPTGRSLSKWTASSMLWSARGTLSIPSCLRRGKGGTSMFKVASVVLFLGIVSLAIAQNSPVGYTDTPMLPNLPYRVHDPARPHPAVVTPAAQVGGAPSDAIVLFDGRD